MKPIFFHLALCFLLLLGGCKSLLEKGNEQFLSGQYQLAIGTFKQVLAKDSSNLRARQVMAESYRLSNRIEASTPHYEALVAAEPTFDSYFHLGQSHKANQQVESAKKAFEQAALLTSDDRLLARVKQELRSLELAASIGEYFPNYLLELLSHSVYNNLYLYYLLEFPNKTNYLNKNYRNTLGQILLSNL
jgi:tetratricopeptide (TPR) repeat protein